MQARANQYRLLPPFTCLRSLWLATCALLLCPAAAAGDQIVLRFKEKPRTSENVVRFGDLIEVLSGGSQSTDRMMQAPLGPAPRDNQWQTWHSQDVLQHLELHGLHPGSIRWSGASEAKLQQVASNESIDTETISPAFVRTSTIAQAESIVALAIREYLDQKTRERVQWVIEPKVPAKLAEAVRIRRNIVGIGGGQEPWLGEQKFVLQVKDSDRISNISIEASVALPPMVVVATKPLAREQIIAPEMLDFAPLPERSWSEQAKFFYDPQELIGKQLRRSVSSGLPISSDFVGAPMVIQRNEMVEVESISGAVVVRTMARSLGSGAIGELIDIEMIPNKQRMLAEVVGPLKVRVSAVAARGGLERK